MRKAYKDIFIDFDDTLYDTRGNASIALREVFALFRLAPYFPDPKVFFDSYWQANTELWVQYSRGEIARDYLIVQRFMRPLSMASGLAVSEALCLDINDKFLELCSSKPGVIEGAHELMDYLRGRGYRLHICSNGFREVQYKKLNACGLHPYFDTIILSDEVGAVKPLKAFYAAALQVAGAEAETTIMIGDNYQNDILGAMNAGIDAMLFNRWEKGFVPPQRVTYVVEELKDIIYIL